MNRDYAAVEPKRAEVDALEGPTLVVRHIRIADASGRRLGRSFRMKLWPTLVLLKDGKETARLVRPGDANAIRQALAQIDQGEAK